VCRAARQPRRTASGLPCAQAEARAAGRSPQPHSRSPPPCSRGLHFSVSVPHAWRWRPPAGLWRLLPLLQRPRRRSGRCKARGGAALGGTGSPGGGRAALAQHQQLHGPRASQRSRSIIISSSSKVLQSLSAALEAPCSSPLRRQQRGCHPFLRPLPAQCRPLPPISLPALLQSHSGAASPLQQQRQRQRRMQRTRSMRRTTPGPPPPPWCLSVEAG